MNWRRFRYGLLLYAAFDLFFGGFCGGFLSLTPAAAAQFTTVSGTVTDPNGVAYANGTITPVLISSGTPTFTSTGLGYTPPSQPVGLNAAGKFVMNLADNTQLSPGGSQWNFTVCSGVGTVQPGIGTGPVCFTLAAPITITGASQSITAQLSAAAPALSVNFGGGNVLGPGGSSINDLVCWNNLTGTAISDCGVAFTAVLINPMTTLGDVITGGTAGAPTRLAGPTTPNGVPSTLTSVPSGGVATAPTFSLPGIVGRSVTGANDTIASTDCNPKRVVYTGAAAVAVTLPTPTTLGVGNCSLKLANNTSATVTITPTTWTISTGSGGTAGASLAVLSGQEAVLFVDPLTANNWAADVVEQALAIGATSGFSRGATGISLQVPAYAADTGAANAYAVTVPGYPASIGTGLCVKFKAANAATGASTLNVTPTGGAAYGAIALDKRTTAGVAALGASGDIAAGGFYEACYDGTEWVLSTPSSTVYTGGGLTTSGILTGNSNNQISGSSNATLDATHSFFAKLNNETLAAFGVGYVRAVTSQKSETGSADASVLALTPASAVGTYRVCYGASVSSATSGVIGFTLSWTDSNGNGQSNIALSLFQQGTAAPALTFTTSAAGNYAGCTIFDVNNAGAGITLKWVGGGTTAAKASGVIERMQ